MKTTLMLSAFLPIFLIIGCLADIEDDRAVEVKEIIDKHRPDLTVTLDEVQSMLGGGSEPCQYDYDVNGVVNSGDLVTVLGDFGGIYNSGDLASILGVYGEEYVVDVIPAWNNYAHLKCNGGWDVFLKKQCNGIRSDLENDESFNLPYDITWIHNGEVISTDRDQLEFQAFDSNSNPRKECFGWITPCSGINEITMRVELYGHTYERTEDGYIQIPNHPNPIQCGSPFQTPNLFIGQFEPLQFLVD